MTRALDYSPVLPIANAQRHVAFGNDAASVVNFEAGQTGPYRSRWLNNTYFGQ